MHSYFKQARRRRSFTIGTLLLGLCMHARAGTLTISGQPASSVVAGRLYNFRPTISGDYSRYVRFYVANRPAWLTFSRSTGTLSGTPAASDVGTYSNIVISVSGWKRQAFLPAFSITVQPSTAPAPTPPPPPTNTAPTISGIPATSGTAGRLYSFVPSASDADGDTLIFSVQNKPSWASFNTATGALSGTPSAEGQYSNITLSASDGNATAALAAFNLTISPITLGKATISWSAPATNIDGTPLTTLAGFRVLYGTDPTQLNQELELPSPSFTSVQIEALTPGTYYFVVKAYNAAALESDASPVVWKTIM